MKKIFQIHVLLEKDLRLALEREATSKNISLSELCRQKLRESSQLTRIEILLERLVKKESPVSTGRMPKKQAIRK